jgi:hypothetical protein
MIQFYFLSILFNALTGYVLALENEGGDSFIESKAGFSFTNETIRLVLGILAMGTGLLQLLSSVPGDMPVIGDLIPAAAGLVGGFVLVLEYYQSRSTLKQEETEKAVHALVKNRKWIGFLSLAAAALHFLFPSVLLL